MRFWRGPGLRSKIGAVSATDLPDGFVVLHENDYYLLAEHAADKVVIARRKPGDLLDADKLARAFAEMFPLIRADHREFGLLLDARAARGNNDGDFESQVKSVNKMLGAAFRRVVTVVRTEVGRLQTQRLINETGGQDRFFVTTDADEGLTLAGQA